jgi:hypothetical protein
MPLIPRKRSNKKPAVTSSPRAKQTGTSYSAKGYVPLSPQDYTEHGSSTAGIIFNPVPELSNRTQQNLTFTKMYRSSVSVRIGIRAGESPVVGGDYYVDPASNDPLDVQIAEFVRFNLFESPTVPFKRMVRGICNSMYRNGNAVREIIWELREWSPAPGSTGGANRKQYTVLKKLAVRPSTTIKEIQYDQNGGPQNIVQNAINPIDGSVSEVTIPITKSVIFSYEEDDGDLLGNSILMPAFEHWTYISPLYKIDGIQKERHGIGIPDIQLQAGYTNDDKSYAHVVGANLRTNQRSYVVTNPRVKIEFLKPQGQMVDALKSAEYHDTMILKSIMVQFLNMGIMETGGGGRATGATAMDMFLKSMRYVGESICDQINTYLIPQMVAYNFNTDAFPRLKVRNIGETKDLQMWAAAMANLIGRGAIAVDEDTEDFIREQVDFPRRTTPRPETPITDVRELLQGVVPGQGGGSIAANQTGAGVGQKSATNTKGNVSGGKVQTGNVGKSASSGIV